MKHFDKLPVYVMKTRWLTACAILAGLLFSASCKKEPFHAAYFSFIDDAKGSFAKELQVPADGGVKTFTLVSNRVWSIEYQQTSWLTISPTSGSGVATISFTVVPNETLDEDFTTLTIVNNTLTVIKDFKITRQNYLGDYKGKAAVYSPIDKVCTTCVVGEETTIVSSALFAYDEDSGKITLNFTATIKPDGTNFVFELPFEGTMRKETTGDGIKFVFDSAGTYNMDALGTALGDASITGEKDTVINGELVNGTFNATVMIDPGANNTVDFDKTTTFTFEGSK